MVNCGTGAGSLGDQCDPTPLFFVSLFFSSPALKSTGAAVCMCVAVWLLGYWKGMEA